MNYCNFVNLNRIIVHVLVLSKLSQILELDRYTDIPIRY